jgi:membrane protease YdiL (CAAX protease family)
MTATTTTGSRGLAGLARRHPEAVFLTLALGLGWTALTIPDVAGQENGPFLVLMLLVLAGTALLVTHWAEGPGAVRRLLARALLWRFEPWRYAVILLGMPVTTFAVAGLLGTAVVPDDWAAFIGTYLFMTVVFGFLLANLWEELAWTGFLQARFMARHGLLLGSLMTAPWFFAIHVPLSFTPGWTWSSALVNLALVLVLAPVMRLLLGMHYLDTRGSLLAVGLQHSAFNASGDLGSEGWEYVIALVVLTAVVAGIRAASRHRDRVTA